MGCQLATTVGFTNLSPWRVRLPTVRISAVGNLEDPQRSHKPRGPKSTDEEKKAVPNSLGQESTHWARIV